MRVLVDHCVPRELADHIRGHDVTTVAALGWQTLKDGALLDVAGTVCDAFVTIDKSIRFQQRLDHRPFGVILLRAKSSRIFDLLPLVPTLLEALTDLKSGDVREIARQSQ